MLKVMIVDNEAVIRKGLIHCISWADLDCVIAGQAEDGLDALEQVENIMPDIVICDICMPGMDGLEFAKTLRQRYPHVKVIILTGFPYFEYAQKAISCQIVDFVLKPTSVEDLTRAVIAAKQQISRENIGKRLKEELKDKEYQNLILQQRLLLRDLLQGKAISHLYLLNRMVQLNLDLSGYLVIHVDIAPLSDAHDEAPDEEEKLSAYLSQVQSILESCLSGADVYFVSNGSQSCYGIAAADDAVTVQEACIEAVNVLNSFREFLMYIGISDYFKAPEQMSEAANQADHAVGFARYTPEIPVVMFTELPSIPAEVMDRIYEDIKLLQSAIENQNFSSASGILKSLFLFIKENRLPLETVKNICLYVHQFCVYPLLLPGVSLKRLMEQNSAGDLEEITLHFIKEHLKERGGAGEAADELINKVKAYAAKHYMENLSLDCLACEVHLSPSYLSRLFKKVTGENLSAYVQNIRIEEAKILLKTTELRAYEVGERVGIPDPVYFSRIFKKMTGCKPKDYREESGCSRQC